jgi:hypothetical protein
MVPSVPWPVSWLTGCQRPAGSLRPSLPRHTRPVALLLDGRNDPITVARAAPALHRLPEHHGRRILRSSRQCRQARVPSDPGTPGTCQRPVEVARSELASAAMQRRCSSPAPGGAAHHPPRAASSVPLIPFIRYVCGLAWWFRAMRLIRGTGMHQINHEAPINHISRETLQAGPSLKSAIQRRRVTSQRLPRARHMTSTSASTSAELPGSGRATPQAGGRFRLTGVGGVLLRPSGLVYWRWPRRM